MWQTAQYLVFVLAHKSFANPARRGQARVLVGFQQMYAGFLPLIPKVRCYECHTCAGRILHLQMVAFHLYRHQDGCITHNHFTSNPLMTLNFRPTKLHMVILNSLLSCAHVTRSGCSFILKKVTAMAWRCCELGLLGQVSATHEPISATLCATEAAPFPKNNCCIDNS